MKTTTLNTPEGLRWAKEVIGHYRNWSAVRAISKRNADGIWQVPWPPNGPNETKSTDK